MSTTKVPTAVRRLIDLYNIISRKQNSLYAEEVESFLHNTSDSSLRNKRWSLLNKNARKGLDFKVDRNRERRLFQDPIQFGPNELKETKYLFKDQSKFKKTKGVLPGLPVVEKSTSVYNADIESTISAYFDPSTSLSMHKSHQNSFKFYLQRLMGAPIMIIFKQKCDLLSQTSMDQWNQPYFEMRKRVSTENEKNKGQRLPPFELTKLTHPDTFSLALKSDTFMRRKGQNFEQLVKSQPWNEVEKVDDKLAIMLKQEQNVCILTRSDSHEVSKDDFALNTAIDETMQITKKSTFSSNIIDNFPYTLIFNRFYLLNLLNLDADVSSFESLWTTTELEIVGARLALHDPAVRSLLQTLATTVDLHHASSYEEILRLAKLAKPEETGSHGLNGVIQTLASNGLTNTTYNEATNALYLTKSK
ncbi:hypothetical protein KGF57_003482 [Candida theae]|uniref:Uncharacterized protein n=1 Tax=Candida theae TaxID=1198502 RepID=A0AAD5BCY8_9ASCO|nr:uncharacterized protein KGF57_003482 [Candida theae]KAI5955996.1 hypothetical protein KGF57_003482 [Candida theae]